jgi:hypothetical protein
MVKRQIIILVPRYVGAPFNNGNGSSAGHVRVYRRNVVVMRNATSTAYTPLGVDIDGKAAGEWFGYSVSVSTNGTTLVAGAPFNNGNRGLPVVRVYRFNGTAMAYRQVGSDILGEFARDFFGYSVSMSADGMSFVVGAPSNSGNGIGAGHVRVYRFSECIHTIGIGY